MLAAQRWRCERGPGAIHHGTDALGRSGLSPWEQEDRFAMTVLFKAQAFRVLLALGALAGSAFVLEAGRRWI